jgi:hypothetical protein
VHKPITAPHSDSKKNGKEIPDLLPSANMKDQNSTFKASSTRQTLTRYSQNQSTIRHTKRYGHKPARQRSQHHKNNMKNHRSLQRTLLQAEIQKNSEKQPFTHSDSKQNSKEIPDLLPSANMGKRVSTFKN